MSYCTSLLVGLRGKLPKEINLPASITVPFGSFEEVLKQANNKKIKKQLDAAIKDIPEEKSEEALSKCRELVMQVSICCRLMNVQALQLLGACTYIIANNGPGALQTSMQQVCPPVVR